MADDGEVKIGTKIDTSGIDKGIKSISQKLENLKKSLSSSKMANIGASITGAFAAFNVATKAIKSTTDAIKDLTETYKVQAKAEIQLETAAKNNPYLDTSAINRLKAYASELQHIGTVGDETLIPMMGQLAASGRTEAEIQQIMKAALDASASGAISLDSAVQGLNLSYSGQIGMLGRTLPILKDLTAEELKQGKAVEAVAKAYGGMAKNVADATGAREQLQNAWGDTKELFGKGFNAILSPFQKLLTSALNGFNSIPEKLDKAINKFLNANKPNDGSLTGGEAKNKIEREYANQIKKLKEQTATKKDLEDVLKAYDQETKSAKTNRDKYRDVNTLESQIAGLRNQITQLRGGKAEYSLSASGKMVKESSPNQAEISKLEKQINDLISEKERRETWERIFDDVNKEVSKMKETYQQLYDKQITATQLEADQNAQGFKDKYTETINAKKQEIELRRTAGEEITAEQEAQELLNAKTAAFMELAKGFKDVNNIYIDGKNVLDDIAESAEKAYTEELKARNEAEQLKEATQAESKAKEKFTELSALDDKRTESEKFRDQITELQVAYEDYLKVTGDSLDEQYEMERQLKDKLSELWKDYRAAQEQEEKEKNEKRKEQIQNVVNFTTQSMSQAADIMKQASDLMLKTVQNETNAELATLEKKYLEGEILEEEYEKKKIDAKKKAAKEEYKIQMFQWSASILQATANIAQGVAAALSQKPPASFISAGLVGAAGAVQIASIIASKPTPPSFAGGGIVQGNSYTGDKVRANVNSGEMILNATQQKALWEVANGRNANGNNGANIIINNSASNIVNAQPRITKDQIEIMIDARVNEGLKNGLYDQSLTMANQGMGGEFYGI